MFEWKKCETDDRTKVPGSCGSTDNNEFMWFSEWHVYLQL